MVVFDTASETTLIVPCFRCTWQLDRFWRSMRYLLTTNEERREQRVGFQVLRNGVIDTTNACGKLVFKVFSALRIQKWLVAVLWRCHLREIGTA